MASVNSVNCGVRRASGRLGLTQPRREDLPGRGRRLSRRFEQLDRVAVRVLDLNLTCRLDRFPSRSGNRRPVALQRGDESRKIGDPKHDTVPSAGLLPLPIRQRPGSGRSGTAAAESATSPSETLAKAGSCWCSSCEAQVLACRTPPSERRPSPGSGRRATPWTNVCGSTRGAVSCGMVSLSVCLLARSTRIAAVNGQLADMQPPHFKMVDGPACAHALVVKAKAPTARRPMASAPIAVAPSANAPNATAPRPRARVVRVSVWFPVASRVESSAPRVPCLANLRVVHGVYLVRHGGFDGFSKR